MARYEVFCRSRKNHYKTLAVVKHHDPDGPNYNPERPLHVHALTLGNEQKGGWNTANPKYWDFEGTHPNIKAKTLSNGPGGSPVLTAFHYLWKAVGEHGEDVNDLMTGELTLEELEEMIAKGSGKSKGKSSRAQVCQQPGQAEQQELTLFTKANLEDGEEITSAPDRAEYYA